MDTQKLLVEALQGYLSAGSKEARREASEKAKYALHMAGKKHPSMKDEGGVPVNPVAVQFEHALKNLIGEFGPQLTVAEAVGILELAKGNIFSNVFNPDS